MTVIKILLIKVMLNAESKNMQSTEGNEVQRPSLYLVFTTASTASLVECRQLVCRFP